MERKWQGRKHFQPPIQKRLRTSTFQEPLLYEQKQRFMNIAVQGCCHGELDTIYQNILEWEFEGASIGNPDRKVDLLVICGDFESIRDEADLDCIAVPDKFKKLTTFAKYLSGEKVAPVLTLFIGGNHEASNLLQSLYYGGFVCHNIYFLGFAGVVRFGPLRIGGISGIFSKDHYQWPHFERPPYTPSSLRSIYHTREIEVLRLYMLAQSSLPSPLHLFMSHDWPAGVWQWGDWRGLLRRKKHFQQDMQTGELGSPPLMTLLHSLRPAHWFSAHLHCRLTASIFHEALPPLSPPPPPSTDILALERHEKDSEEEDHHHEEEDPPFELDQEMREEMDKRKLSLPPPLPLLSPECTPSPPQPPPSTGFPATHFLALDKVLPGREYLEFVQVPVPSSSDPAPLSLLYDVEWLAILKRTHSLLSPHSPRPSPLPPPSHFPPISAQELEYVNSRLSLLCPSRTIPSPFSSSPSPPPPLDRERQIGGRARRGQEGNAQTDSLLSLLGLDHIWTVPCHPELPTPTTPTTTTPIDSPMPPSSPSFSDDLLSFLPKKSPLPPPSPPLATIVSDSLPHSPHPSSLPLPSISLSSDVSSPRPPPPPPPYPPLLAPRDPPQVLERMQEILSLLLRDLQPHPSPFPIALSSLPLPLYDQIRSQALQSLATPPPPPPPPPPPRTSPPPPPLVPQTSFSLDQNEIDIDEL